MYYFFIKFSSRIFLFIIIVIIIMLECQKSYTQARLLLFISVGSELECLFLVNQLVNQLKYKAPNKSFFNVLFPFVYY